MDGDHAPVRRRPADCAWPRRARHRSRHRALRQAPWKTPPGFLDRHRQHSHHPRHDLAHGVGVGLYSLIPPARSRAIRAPRCQSLLPGAVEICLGAVEAPRHRPAAPAAAAPPPHGTGSVGAPGRARRPLLDRAWSARGLIDNTAAQVPHDQGWPNGSGECGPEGVTRREMGGDLDSGTELHFVPPDTLASGRSARGPPTGPVKDSQGRREARTPLRRAHLDGSTVKRIRIDSASKCSDRHVDCPRFTYVDQTLTSSEKRATGSSPLPDSSPYPEPPPPSALSKHRNTNTRRDPVAQPQGEPERCLARASDVEHDQVAAPEQIAVTAPRLKPSS